MKLRTLTSATPFAIALLLTTTVFAGPGVPSIKDMKQIADPDFDASVDQPAFTDEHPVILFDEGHHNLHKSAGRFKPFATLMSNDGYRVRPTTKRFDQTTLAGADVLVIANAAAADTPSTAPAFTAKECDAVAAWVGGGGSLLLIADHAPHGSAAKILANRFDVDMRDGYTKDRQHCFKNLDYQLVFTRDNQLLARHGITKGRNEGEFIRRVMSFGGQSLAGPEGSTAFLKLADTATDQPSFKSPDKTSAAGRAQGIALPFGKGRVVVLGEAAMVTAQVLWIRNVGTQSPMGMNFKGIDNRQLTLNMMHWLSGLID